MAKLVGNAPAGTVVKKAELKIPRYDTRDTPQGHRLSGHLSLYLDISADRCHLGTELVSKRKTLIEMY
jgi:hypothetical protein